MTVFDFIYKLTKQTYSGFGELPDFLKYFISCFISTMTCGIFIVLTIYNYNTGMTTLSNSIGFGIFLVCSIFSGITVFCLLIFTLANTIE